jgi:hypothetical protein
MKEEKKYQITGTTNGWIAQRDLKFNGKTRIIIEKELTLKEAYKKLLDMFNSDYEDKGWYAKNWGIAVNISKQKASPTCSDGTRMYEYDGRYYQIEEQEEPESITIMSEKEFVEKLNKKVNEIGKGYSIDVDPKGYIHINGANHICFKVCDNMVRYVACGGNRIAYNDETIDNFFSDLENKLLTREEINQLYRSLFNEIKNND